MQRVRTRLSLRGRRRAAFALCLAAVAALAWQIATAAGMQQLPGRAGCVGTEAGRAGCAPARGVDGADGVTVSGDGRHVYTAAEHSDAVAAFARGRGGRLRQLRGPRGCLADNRRGGCPVGRALGGAYAVALSPDGRHAYVPGQEDDSLVALARNRRTGALTQLSGEAGCLGRPRGCGPGRGLSGAFGAAVSQNGRFVYVASEFSNAVAAFARNRSTGEVTQLDGEQGCVSLRGRGGCAPGRGLRGATSVVLSPDGRSAYGAGSEGVALAVLRRNSRTGALRQAPGRAGCVALRGATRCRRARALAGPIASAVSRDGRHVYVAASGSSAIAVFARNRRTGALRQLAGSRGCIAERGRHGCRPARALATPMAVKVSPNGRRVYVAAFGSNAVTILARNRRTGALRQLAGRAGCLGPAQLGCTPARGLGEAVDVTLAPGGRQLYVASEAAGIAVFRR
jgi:DNA-binding beta-propeller fold protein YncE